MCFIKAWLVLVMLVACGEAKELEVKTDSGVVKGRRVIAEDGRKVIVFLGIPFAAPTGGANRFAPPKEVGPWEGTLDASDFSGPCYQVVPPVIKTLFQLSQSQETEDCLKLNIWVPKHRPQKAAVMVWIHGGGFVYGSSDMLLYNGTTLAAQENIIVVSLNYRLSLYGFLYLNHPDAPGNVGLMDQAAGLRWIKKNIQYFGGDPDRITIFGESAGGASVGFQLLLPSSAGLFRNAILESGTPNTLWSWLEKDDVLEYSLRLARQAGCPDDERRREDTLRCLQNLSAEELRTLSVQAGSLFFRPVTDGSYLTSELLSGGTFSSQKNILTGFTRDDGALILKMKSPSLDVGEDAAYTEEEFENIIRNLTYVYKQSTSHETGLVKFLYTDWNATDDRFSVRHQMIRYSTDRWFGCPTLSFSDRALDNGNNIYSYRFDHVPESREGNPPIPSWMGATHTDELFFVFGQKLRQDPPASADETRLAKLVMRYWANFARNDDPNDEYLPLWPKYSHQDRLRLHINSKLTVAKKTDRLRECTFWKNTFPKITVLSKDDL